MALASPIYVVNELLMYVISKLDTDNQNDIKNVVNTFYGDEAVSDAKSLLWEHYSSKLDRSITRRSRVKNIDDILDAIRIINVAYPDKDTLPVVFVTVRTSNLPFLCEKMSPSRESFVESRLAALELQMVEVLARPTMPIADNARLDNVSYSSRIKYGTASKPAPEPNDGHHVVPPASPPDHESGTQSRSRIAPITTKQPKQRNHTDDNSMSQAGWQTIGVRKSRRPVAVYGNKKSDGLKAPARKYECVVFNVTTGDKSEVSKRISDNDVNMIDVSRLSKGDADAHLFKACVEYKAKDTVLSSDFWPEYVGCRPFFRVRKQPNRVTNGE